MFVQRGFQQGLELNFSVQQLNFILQLTLEPHLYVQKGLELNVYVKRGLGLNFYVQKGLELNVYVQIGLVLNLNVQLDLELNFSVQQGLEFSYCLVLTFISIGYQISFVNFQTCFVVKYYFIMRLLTSCTKRRECSQK